MNVVKRIPEKKKNSLFSYHLPEHFFDTNKKRTDSHVICFRYQKAPCPFFRDTVVLRPPSETYEFMIYDL